MDKHRSKRIYYAPGMISLLLLVWLCFWFLNPTKHLRKVRMMEIVMPDSDIKANDMFSIYNFPKRINHSITLTGNKNEDKIKLEYVQLELRRIINENDSIHGLHVIFKDSAKYWTMIKLFDICNIENFPRYYLFKNDFYAAHVSQKKDVENIDSIFPIRCGTGDLMNRIRETKEKELEENQFKIEIQNRIKNYFWSSALIFLSMVFLSFRQLYLFRK